MQLIILLISGLLFLGYAVLLLYYRFSWTRIPAFPHSTFSIQHSTYISVIIPARNEENNLPVLLDSLRDQTYPRHLFEVLIIDDHSTDRTAQIVNTYSAANIKLIALKDFIAEALNSYKKKAIDIGIQQSAGSLIVTTDADCYLPPRWLETIASYYEKEQPAFIAAPVAIDCGPRFIEIFQALDFMTLQGITGAAAHKRIHSMCNGANMAYEKKAFYEVGGFQGIDSIASGDDMLLMHKIARRYPERIRFLKSTEAIVQTAPVKTIAAFFNQRIRWVSKADKYDDKRILPVLLLVYLLNVMMLALPLIAIFNNYKLSIINCQLSIVEVWILFLLAKIIIELIFLYPVAKFFHKQSLLWLFPIMQPFHILYTIIAGWLGKFGSYSWKGRKVK